ncbi:MAG: hypothetical protein ACPGJV_08660 [Bacteriovoracaceae bacterium]
MDELIVTLVAQLRLDSESLIVNDSADVELFALIVWFDTSEIVGAVFGDVTVSVKVSLEDKTSSETVRVIVDVPDCPAFGVKVTVQFGAVPAKVISEESINVVFEEEADTLVVHPIVESVSRITKLMAPVLVFMTVD